MIWLACCCWPGCQLAGWLGTKRPCTRACYWLLWLCAVLLVVERVAAALACPLFVSGRPCAARSKRSREKRKAHRRVFLLDVVVNILLAMTKLMLCYLQKQHAKVKVRSLSNVAQFERVIVGASQLQAAPRR